MDEGWRTSVRERCLGQWCDDGNIEFKQNLTSHSSTAMQFIDVQNTINYIVLSAQ